MRTIPQLMFVDDVNRSPTAPACLGLPSGNPVHSQLEAAVILEAKSEIKTFVNVSQSVFAPGNSQAAGIKDTRRWRHPADKIKNAAPLARSRTR